MINLNIVIAFLMHVILCILFLLDPQIPFVGYILAPFAFGNLIGILLISSGKKILGSKVFLLSSIAFVPVGFIGIIGAKKLISEVKAEDLVYQS